MKKYVFADTVKLNKEERATLAKSTRNEKLLYRLAFDKCEDVLAAVASNRFAPSYVLRTAIDNIDGWNWDFYDALSKNTQVGDDIISYVLSHKGRDINTDHLTALLSHIKSTALFAQIARTAPENVRRAIAESPQVPYDVLDALAYDPDDQIRKKVASRCDIDPTILEILSYDPSARVRSAVVQNPLTPADSIAEILHGLKYSDLDSWDCTGMLEALGQRRDISTEDLSSTLDMLLEGRAANGRGSYYGDRAVQQLLQNRNIAPDTLLKVCALNDGTFICSALNSPSATTEVANYVAGRINRREIDDRGVTAAALAKTDDADFIRAHYRGVGGTDYDFIESMAKNIHTPRDILGELESYHRYSISNMASRTLEKQLMLNSNARPAAPRKKSTTGWEVSPYKVETYEALGDELDYVVTKAMNAAAKQLKCTLEYQFNPDDYDNATELTITTSNGGTFTIDAQRFLALITSDSSKTVGAKKGADYICKSATLA